MKKVKMRDVEIKTTIQVPEGDYCHGCGYFKKFYNSPLCIFYEENPAEVPRGFKKSRECLRRMVGLPV